MIWKDRRLSAMGTAFAIAASLVPAFAFGQATKTAQPASKPAAKEEKPERDTRLYFFSEAYRPARPIGLRAPVDQAIGQYVVGFQDKRTRTADQLNGPPEKTVETTLVRYVERPDEVYEDEPNRVRNMVRRYESVSKADGLNAAQKELRSFRGVTIDRREQPDALVPLIVMLAPIRPIDIDEFRLMATTEIFMPYLSLLLPEKALRVGEKWKVRNEGAALLVGKHLGDGELIGTYKEFQAAAGGKTRLAIFDFLGKNTEAQVHAELTFAFVPPPPAPDRPEEAAGEAGELPYISARGAIVKLRMSTEYREAISRSGRLHATLRRDLLIGRGLTKVGEPLTIAEKPAEPTPENSWLVYRDPFDRFSFRFPQSFPPRFNTPLAKPDAPYVLEHHDDAEGASDLLAIVAVADRSRSVSECFAEAFADTQKATGVEIFPAMGERRPAPNWPGMRVDHRSAEGRGEDKNQPSVAQIDVYVIRPDAGGLFIAESTTNRRVFGAFHTQIESILKTLRPERPSK